MKPAQACRKYHRRGFVLVAILIIAALVIGVSGILGYQKLSTKPSPSPQSSATSQSPTPDETVYTEESQSANWKVYANRDQGYSHGYPTDWEIKNSPETDLPGIFGCNLGFFVGFKVVRKTGFGACAFLLGTNYENEAAKEAGNFKAVYTKKIILNQRQVIEQKLTDPDYPPGTPMYYIYSGAIMKGEPGTLIFVGFNGDGKYSDEEFQKIFDQILSTFKFLD